MPDVDIFGDDAVWESVASKDDSPKITNPLIPVEPDISPKIDDPVIGTKTCDIPDQTISTTETEAEALSTPTMVIDAPIVVKRFVADDIPNIKVVAGMPQEYLDVVEDIKNDYKDLPFIRYDDTYKEIQCNAISIKSIPTPSLQSLNQELERVQAAKERLSKIFIDVIHCYNIKKRLVDILDDDWSRYSQEKSADKRSSEASFITTDFRRDFSYIETLYKACEHIYGVLESAHDTLSRKVTVIQLELKQHEMGRGALPDFDYNKQSSRLDVSNSVQIDPTKPIDAEERDFLGA